MDAIPGRALPPHNARPFLSRRIDTILDVPAELAKKLAVPH